MRFFISFALMFAAFMGGMWLSEHFGLELWQTYFLVVALVVLTIPVEWTVFKVMKLDRVKDPTSKE